MSRKSKRRAFRRWYLAHPTHRFFVIGLDMAYSNEDSCCVWPCHAGPDGRMSYEVVR